MPSPSQTVFRKEDYPSSGLGSKEALEQFLRPLNSALGSLQSTLTKRLTFGDNLDAELKTVNLKTPADPWTYVGTSGAPAFGAGWTNGATGFEARFYKDAYGRVYVDGGASCASTGAAFTLPAGSRPGHEATFATFINHGGTEGTGRLSISTAGVVTIGTTSPTTFGSFGCSFLSADGSPGVLGCFPITVSTAVASPKAVWIAQINDTTSNGNISSATGCHWKPFGNGQIQIMNIPGLTLGHSYEITFLISGG